MHHPTDRITHSTAFVTPVVEHWLEREIANHNRRHITACYLTQSGSCVYIALINRFSFCVFQSLNFN